MFVLRYASVVLIALVILVAPRPLSAAPPWNKLVVFKPGLVNTEMTGDQFPEGAPWTPPELAPRLVLELASGRFDALAGRYLHAEHDPPDVLESRIDRILAEDLNAIRLRRES